MPDPFPTARDPLLSMLQSAAASLAHHQSASAPALSAATAYLVAARADPTRAYAGPSNLAAPAMTCAGLGLELLEAIVADDRGRERALRDRLQFSKCDPLWGQTLVEYAAGRLLGPVPYIRYAQLDDFMIAAPRSTVRIALLSDWGTGTDIAHRVAALLARQRPDIVIHLGDIYYSGTAGECQRHFLAPLRGVLPDVRLFALCGNHDVYSGGRGYYGLLREIGQPASYFCLRSPDQTWQILAADTGLHDSDPTDEAVALTRLEPAEEAWHADKLRGFPGQTMFLTHHQPFSALAQIGDLAAHSPVNPNLMASYGRLASAGRIDAWFWGHEHRLQLYEPYRGISNGRNIGYGAIPVEAVPGRETPLPGLIDPPHAAVDLRLDVVDGAYTHGFALLDCSPDGLAASYWALTQPDGAIYHEDFSGTNRPVA